MIVRKFQEVSLWHNVTKISWSQSMVLRGSRLGFCQGGVHSALRNDAKLTIAHVIDTRALQSVSTFDAEVYEQLQVDAGSLMKEYENVLKMLVWQMFISSLKWETKDPTGTYYSRC